MRLMRDPQHRSDQWAAEVDGVAVVDAAGLTRLHDLLRERWPKAQSRRTLCAAQDGYSARDEADAAAA